MARDPQVPISKEGVRISHRWSKNQAHLRTVFKELNHSVTQRDTNERSIEKSVSIQMSTDRRAVSFRSPRRRLKNILDLRVSKDSGLNDETPTFN